MGGLLGAGAVALAGVARAASPAFERAFANLGANLGDTPAAPTVAAAPSGLTAYQSRVLTVAARERARLGAAVPHGEVVGIADFALPSSLPRLHFVDLVVGRVDSYFVAHGRGSDPEHDGWLKNFSNVVGSEATSRGAYLTGEWYQGHYGTAMRMTGLDADNSNAFDRAIVMHPAWYASADMLSRYGKLGRSEGCFAMAPDQFSQALIRLGQGHLLFADRIAEA